jgi:hypothetical protein
VIDFTIDDARDQTGSFRLLDHRKAAAVELAGADAKRWEIETAFDELKTHQRGPRAVLRPHGSGATPSGNWPPGFSRAADPEPTPRHQRQVHPLACQTITPPRLGPTRSATPRSSPSVYLNGIVG